MCIAIIGKDAYLNVTRTCSLGVRTMFRVVSCLMSSSMMVTSFSTTSEVRRNLSEIKDSNMLLILQLNIFTLLARPKVGYYFS